MNTRIEYNDRQFILEYNYRKAVKINNIKDFIDSYDGIEKLIQKVICRGRIL